MATAGVQRTLTVYTLTGLSNRLQVLISGLALAAASGRHFRMLWPLTKECGAPFHVLFANDWDVVDVDPQAVADMPYISAWFGQLPNLLEAPEQELAFGYGSSLLRPDWYPEHAAVMHDRLVHFAALAPIPELQDRITEFREKWFRNRMIGVHLRRGDFLRARPDVAGGTKDAAAAVDAFLQKWPDAGVFLCTDDGAPDPRYGATKLEGVREWFTARYGERLIQPLPRSLDRSTPEAIQDAVVELWLLRSTDAFVGTQDSTFSGLAVLGRSTPYTLLAVPTPAYGRYEQLARMVGAYQIINALGHRHFQRDLPFPALYRHYRRYVLRLLKDPDHALKRKFGGKKR